MQRADVQITISSSGWYQQFKKNLRSGFKPFSWLTLEARDGRKPISIYDRVRNYFNKGEVTARHPRAIGYLERRKVCIVHHEYIGKESHSVDMEVTIDGGGTIAIPHIEPW
jgi:hypothetical protein